MDVCLLWVLCVVKWRYLRRADHSSRGVLPTVVCCYVWSRNLVNKEALAHWGLLPPPQKKFRTNRIYLLTPRRKVLLEKLTGHILDKKLPTFYGTRRFITAFTSARHLSLSWARSFQSMLPYPTYWRSPNLMSLFHCLGHTKASFRSEAPVYVS
jgi:hypothetical protein